MSATPDPAENSVAPSRVMLTAQPGDAALRDGAFTAILLETLQQNTELKRK